MCFEDAVDGVEQFAGDGDEGLHFGFVAGDQVLIEGFDVGVLLGRDQCGHVEDAAQVSVSGAADAGRLVDGGAGDLVGWIETAVGNPLAGGHLGGEQGEFAKQLESADPAMPGMLVSRSKRWSSSWSARTSSMASRRSLRMRFVSEARDRFRSCQNRQRCGASTSGRMQTVLGRACARVRPSMWRLSERELELVRLGARHGVNGMRRLYSASATASAASVLERRSDWAKRWSVLGV